MSRDNRSLLNSRSEAKRIYAQRQEIKRLEKEKEHYKHLYSEVKKQKDDVVEYIKENKDKTIAPYGDNEDTDYEVCLFEEDINEILRMLGEIDE